MSDYVSIRTSTLRGDQSIPFKVYLPLGEKMILYVREGQPFDSQRLKKIKEKRVKKLFIEPQDEESYRDYLSANIEAAYGSDSTMSTESRAQIVQGHQQYNAENLMENPTSEESYNTAKSGASKYIDFLRTQGGAVKSIMELDNSEQNVAHHGVSVATYALLLAEELKIPEDQLQLLSLGCLIHDIDQFREDFQKPEKSFQELTAEEKQIYMQHPKAGAERVKDLQFFDRTVLNIVLQHEETINGSGYPAKLNEKSIDPMALVAGVANAMDLIMIHNTVSPNDAAKKLLIDCMGKYPLEHLQAMQAATKKHS